MTEFAHHVDKYLSPNVAIRSLADLIQYNSEHTGPYSQSILEQAVLTGGDTTTEHHIANMAKFPELRERVANFMAQHGLDAVLVSSPPHGVAFAIPDLAGLPVVNIPAGFVDKSIPQGISLYAAKGHECSLLSLAGILEKVPGLGRSPPGFRYAPGPAAK